MINHDLLVILLTALPPTIAAVSGLIVTLRQNKVLDSTHALVNSQLTAVKADLVIANQRIKDLLLIIEAQKGQ